jgi:dipeptidyl aminopeptidase/acylaminoacyl peptidase
MRVSAMWLVLVLSVHIASLPVCSLSSRAKDEAIPPKVNVAVLEQIRKQYPAPIGVSHSGSKILLKINEWNSEKLSIVDSQTKQLVSATSSPNTHLAISWSADDKHLAFLSGEGNSDDYQLFLWTVGESSPQLVGSPQTNTAIQSIRWKPDGTRLAYLVGNNDDAAIWIVDPEKLNGVGSLVAHIRPMSDFEWSPDGKFIAAVLRNSPATLSILDSKDGRIMKTVPVGATPPSEIRDISWAPSGDRIALSARTNGEFFTLFEFDFQTSSIRGCANAGGDALAPHFAADGKTLIYSLSSDSQIALYASNCSGTDIKTLGFASGTTRYLRLLNQTDGSPSAKGSLVVLHNGLEEPPALYRTSIDTGAVSLVFAPPSTSQLRSIAPQTVSLPSSDGTEIPTVIWRATRQGPLSNVVLVDIHGGIHLQKYRRWEFLPHLLNVRGIDVLSPNFRGSEGYGFRYEQSGDIRSQVEDVLAACKYAKKLHGASSRVILLGTSYGSVLAAIAVAKDPQNIDGLVLVSMIPRSFQRSPARDFKPRLDCFQGQNDPQPPDKALTTLQSLFGTGILQREQDQFRVFQNEGHVFRLTSSWAEIYSSILRMGLEISQTKSGINSVD